MLKLKSDFFEFYDHQFDGSWTKAPIFERMSTGGPSRSEMFKMLESAGLTVPRHGTVQELHNLGVGRVVVYEDERAHRGEGKSLLPTGMAISEGLGSRFCSEFIAEDPAISTPSRSLRHLYVGQRTWTLEYTNPTDWRSNCNNAEVKVLNDDPLPVLFPQFPLCAIDYVERSHQLYAIDLNIAPGLEPIKGLISSSEIVSEIFQAFERNTKVSTSTHV